MGTTANANLRRTAPSGPPPGGPSARRSSVSLNPFDEDRLNESGDFHPRWDVPNLNARVSEWLVGLILELKDHPEVSPARKMAVLLANAGYGKTHLFGRVSEALGHDVMFAFVGPIFEAQLPRPIHHVAWNVVESMFDPPASGGPSWIKLLLARLCQASFKDYFDHLPDLWRTRHQGLRDRLNGDPSAVLGLMEPVADLGPYLHLARSLSQKFHTLRAEIVRAIALGWSPAESEARRWLRGDDLPEQDRARLGLPEASPEPERVIEAIATLLSAINVPLVVCCDQLEAVLKEPDIGPMALTNGLVGLLHHVPNTLIALGCLEDAWRVLIQAKLHDMFLDRVYPKVTLSPLTVEQAIELVHRRVDGWDGNQGRGETYPIRRASIVRFAGRPQAPRALIQACQRAIDDWMAKTEDEVDIGGVGPDPFPDVFIKHWNAELAKVQQKAKSPENVQEAQLFQSVRDALDVSRAAGLFPAGVKLIEVKDKALEPTASDPRYSLGLHLDIGGKAARVVVAVSKKDAGVGFAHYVRALASALKAKSTVGCVLVRPYAELNVGPSADARKVYEKAVSDGTLRPFPLGQERLTFDTLECLFGVLGDADDGLPLGGKLLRRADCMKLIAENSLLKGLKLFEFMFGNWGNNGEPVATAIPVHPTAPTAAAAAPEPPPPVVVRDDEKVVPVGEKTATSDEPVQSPTPPPIVHPPPGAQPPPNESMRWAEDLLAKVVEKLRKWSLPVRPLGVEMGPTFTRLKVHPSDMTDINKVRNKAETLRVSLGLESRPMIGFQAGFISIDIQLPERKTVALAPLLKERPEKLAAQPAFPAGLDVAGRAHWLNLADTSNCHLLIAGTTGSGKSEFLKIILASLAHGLTPEQLQLILIDPKRVTFNLSGPSPYLKAPIAYDQDDVLPLTEWCVNEMERRYQLLADRHLSNVSDLTGNDAVPRIVLVFDEFADIMLDKGAKLELEPQLKRLGAKARAAGIHLILGTQRTEASVVTPLLRGNLPGRISLKVATDKDSKLILDAAGAAELLGKGDLLWRQGGDLLRLQSPFVGTEEFEKLLRVK